MVNESINNKSNKKTVKKTGHRLSELKKLQDEIRRNINWVKNPDSKKHIFELNYGAKTDIEPENLKNMKTFYYFVIKLLWILRKHLSQTK